MSKLWVTDLTKTCERVVGKEKALLAQNRRLAFAKKVLPFMLRKTMFHNICPINFSKSGCQVLIPKRNCFPRFMKGIMLKSEKDIKEWMGDWTGWEKGESIKSIGKFKGCGTAVMNRGFCTLFFEPTHTGKDLKIGIFDIDIGAGRTEVESRPMIVQICRELLKMGLYSLPMFTGKSWQVWFKRPDNKPMGSYEEVRDEIIFPVAEKVEGLTVSKTIKRAPPGKISVDYSVNAKRRMIRFFFSQHVSPGGKTHTGKVAIPVKPENVMKFKVIDSHPVKVERRLNEYMKMIDDFLPFGLGQEKKAEEFAPPVRHPKPHYHRGEIETEIKKFVNRLKKHFKGWKIRTKYAFKESYNKFEYLWGRVNALRAVSVIRLKKSPWHIKISVLENFYVYRTAIKVSVFRDSKLFAKDTFVTFDDAYHWIVQLVAHPGKIQKKRLRRKKVEKEDKLLKKIHIKTGYSPSEVNKAVKQFRKELLKGETTLDKIQDDVKELILLRYPELAEKTVELKREFKLPRKRPIRIYTKPMEHPDQKLAHLWKNYRGNWPDLLYDEALKFYRGKKGIIVSVKADGELECLHFKKSGIGLVGEDVKTHKKMTGIKTKTLMANHGSHLYIQNPITTEFEEFCMKKGYKEVILFGEAFGMDKGKMLPFPPRIPGTSNSILTSDDWNAWSKYMQFWAFDIYQIDGKRYFPKVPYKDRLAKLKELFGSP